MHLCFYGYLSPSLYKECMQKSQTQHKRFPPKDPECNSQCLGHIVQKFQAKVPLPYVRCKKRSTLIFGSIVYFFSNAECGTYRTKSVTCSQSEQKVPVILIVVRGSSSSSSFFIFQGEYSKLAASISGHRRRQKIRSKNARFFRAV